MRYANECRTAKTEAASLGKIELVTATGKKDWVKYGVHLLEAVAAILDDPTPATVKNVGRQERDIVYIEYENGIQVVINIFMDIYTNFSNIIIWPEWMETDRYQKFLFHVPR